MEFKDYYQILGVRRDATKEEIKRAYRKLARKYHPDVSKEPDAEARFKDINEANEVLQDPEKRATYDRLGTGWKQGQEFHPPPGAGSFYRTGRFSGDDLFGFSDFFSSIFGGMGQSGGFDDLAMRGRDQTTKLAVSLEEAYHGATRTLQLNVPEADSQGRIVNRPRTLRVRIPPGVTRGRQIRLAGQGLAGSRGGASGDLFLEIELRPHPIYWAEGRDIYLKLPVTPWEAALGATVSVPTLGGPVSLKIPAGSQTGRKLRMRGRGLPGSPPGDEYALIEILVPEATTEQARRAYQRLAEVMPFNPRAKLGA